MERNFRRSKATQTMTNRTKKQEWWQRDGIRFLGGESGSHIPTTQDFALFGYDSGYDQGFEDARKLFIEFMQSVIVAEPAVTSQPKEDE
jgi:hypothetical protein